MSSERYSITIRRGALVRIARAVAASSTETGGKLIGRYDVTEGTAHFVVLDYIDSGPRAESSTTHLAPDGQYQEAVFQLLENYDGSLEHIGTWHSHHCNGLQSLSQGDMTGYVETAANPRYSPPYFLAILVTASRRQNAACRTTSSHGMASTGKWTTPPSAL